MLDQMRKANPQKINFGEMRDADPAQKLEASQRSSRAANRNECGLATPEGPILMTIIASVIGTIYYCVLQFHLWPFYH